VNRDYDRLMSISCRLALSLVFVIAANASAATITGRVTAVADGDSFTLADAQRRSIRVRIQGVDAPERRQGFSYASKQSLSRMIYRRDVIVNVDKEDQYGRVVGTVMVDGRDAGLEQIRAGFAWFYTHYANEMPPVVRTVYIAAQRDAKNARRGLWSETEPVPPWRFRRERPR
jgi:endonuclease YncB( thermonuclease family)